MLHEQYRPQTWAGVVGQDKAIGKLQTLARRGLSGRAIWLSGQSGTGKTTLAYLVAREVAIPVNIRELDASKLTTAMLRDTVERFYYQRPLGTPDRPGMVWVINEAHGLRADVQRQLLILLEGIPEWVTWIFTTTNTGQQELWADHHDAPALLSRCAEIPLARRGLAEAFAQRVHDIAEREGLNGRPVSAYVGLAQRCRNNMRKMLQRVELGGMLGADGDTDGDTDE